MTWTVALDPAAEAELLAMPPDIRARFLHVAELLEAFGPRQVGMPHVRHLEGKLWEMRLTGRGGIARAVYAAHRATADRAARVHQKDAEDPAQGP